MTCPQAGWPAEADAQLPAEDQDGTQAKGHLCLAAVAGSRGSKGVTSTDCFNHYAENKQGFTLRILFISVWISLEPAQGRMGRESLDN